MRLLVLAPSCPFPSQNGVHLRLSNLLRRLPPGARISLLCFDDCGEVRREALPAPLEGELLRVPMPPRPAGWRSSTLVQAIRIEPTMIWRFRSPEMADQVRRLRDEIDGALAVGLQMGTYLDLLPDTLPRALDNYNVESLILSRLAETRTGLKRWYWQWEAGKMRRCERSLIQRAREVFAISDTDRHGMQRLGARCRLHTVPMGVDLEFLRPREARRLPDPVRFTFVGAFNWHVNEDAALWVCREVWPRVRAELPAAELHLVGRDPSAVVRALGERPGVHVVGTVPDVRPYIWESTALLVPLRYGSGVRTKILEAFAAGRPVVSTPVGCEGLDVRHREQLMIAQDPARFASYCVELARDLPLSEAMVRRAEAFVQEQDQQATRMLVEVFTSIFGRPSPLPATPRALLEHRQG